MCGIFVFLQGGKGSALYGTHMPTSFNAVSQKASSTARKALTRAELGDSLEEFLAKATTDKKLARLMVCMGEALRTIAFKVRTASCGATACVNTFGDEQLAVDMLADKLLFEALMYSHVCKYACSEEEPILQDMKGEGFSVAFDPLDGSSIVDTNFTVGTIFGVWPGDKLTGITGRDQAASAMGIYGPRTTYVIAINGFPGTHEFLLMDDGMSISHDANHVSGLVFFLLRRRQSFVIFLVSFQLSVFVIITSQCLALLCYVLLVCKQC